MEKFNKGFTLVELLIVVAVVGVLAGIILIAINPMAQMQKARDARRKSDIVLIAKALEQYEAVNGHYPTEWNCETSLGYEAVCPPTVVGSGWSTTEPPDGIYQSLIGGKYLKILPKDPINDLTYYYQYEPYTASQGSCPAGITYPCRYLIRARLERPSNPAKPFFICTDEVPPNTADTGCKDMAW